MLRSLCSRAALLGWQQPCCTRHGAPIRRLFTAGGRAVRFGSRGRAVERARPGDPGTGPRPWGRLGHATLFAVLGSGGILTGCVIWQYESLRAGIMRARERGRRGAVWEFQPTHRQSAWRQQLHQWWQAQSEGQRLFWPLCLVNVCVFAMFRSAALRPLLARYFISEPTARSFRLPMLLSAFSHMEVWHLAINMFVLHSFSTSGVALLGREQFMFLYLSGALFSSLASYAHKVAFRLGGASLGASGAIFALLGYICTERPDSRLMIVFLPMFTFSAGMALKSVMLLDTLGVALRWRMFDHAAHLGGALFGVLWSLYGQDHVWQKREPILRAWHRLREGDHGGGGDHGRP